MNTRTIVVTGILSAAALMSTSLTACHDTVFGPTTRVERTVNNFSSIEVEDGFEVVLVNDGTESLTIEAPEDAIPHIVTSVLNGRLSVYVDDVLHSGFSPRRVTIHARELSSIDISGGTRLTTVGTFATPMFLFHASGGSEADISVDAQRARIETSGGSSLRLIGSADVLDVESISGGGTLDAFGLTTRESSIEASGGSALEVRVAERLAVDASGGSVIRYKGRPALDVELSGGSRVVDAN